MSSGRHPTPFSGSWQGMCVLWRSSGTFPGHLGQVVVPSLLARTHSLRPLPRPPPSDPQRQRAAAAVECADDDVRLHLPCEACDSVAILQYIPLQRGQLQVQRLGHALPLPCERFSLFPCCSTSSCSVGSCA
jgi:hypothetical protein